MKLISALVFLFGISAFAAEPQVNITSFVLTGPGARTAEICGRVINHTAPVIVRVVIDPYTNPGVYNILATLDGNFCASVVTYQGLAEASISGVLNGVHKIVKAENGSRH